MSAAETLRPRPAPPRLPFVKGHGTRNDFVLVADPDGLVDIQPDDVARVCERRGGLGGDGLVRAVRTRHVPGAEHLAGQAEWFMDYRNADGSLAEMCGNGVRVFVAFLQHLKLVSLADGDRLPVATRAGVKVVRREGARYAVSMGPWHLEGGWPALAADGTADVEAPTAGRALRVDVGNPHAVVRVGGHDRLAALDLSRAPHVRGDDGRDLTGTLNVEFVVAGDAPGHVSMRVHERGSGETLSCGTGAVAVALASRARAVRDAGGQASAGQVPTVWTVDVPGGRLEVRVPDAAQVVQGGDVELVGPALLVAEGELDVRGLHRP